MTLKKKTSFGKFLLSEPICFLKKILFSGSVKKLILFLLIQMTALSVRLPGDLLTVNENK